MGIILFYLAIITHTPKCTKTLNISKRCSLNIHNNNSFYFERISLCSTYILSILVLQLHWNVHPQSFKLSNHWISNLTSSHLPLLLPTLKTHTDTNTYTHTYSLMSWIHAAVWALLLSVISLSLHILSPASCSCGASGPCFKKSLCPCVQRYLSLCSTYLSLCQHISVSLFVHHSTIRVPMWLAWHSADSY